MKGLHTGTEKAAPAWKEWRREFCWEEVSTLKSDCQCKNRK